MRRIGGLKGQGTLVIGERELGHVSYEFDIFEGRGMRTGNGSLSGTTRTLFDALQSNNVTLRLEDGREAGIAVNRFDGVSYATFLISGPVPGY